METMSANKRLMQHLDQISKHLWNIDLDDSAFEEFKKKCSLLSAQLAVHHAIQRTVSHIARHGRSLPVPFAQSRVCKFFDSLYGNDENAKSPLDSKLQELRNLECRYFLLIAVSYTPLDITKMNRLEFDYLVQNTPKYSDMLRPEWIFRKEIQLALAEKSDLANLRIFKKRKLILSSSTLPRLTREGYHELEFEYVDSRPEKRARLGTHNAMQQNSGQSGRALNEGIATNAENSDPFTTISTQSDTYSSPEPSISTYKNNTISHETDSLTGDVYELTQDEVGQIVQSDQIIGTSWLTDTYGANTTSFVTVRISNELTDQLIIGRPRIM